MSAIKWYCVQAGHREQYGIPRALARVGALERLITDLWVPPGSWLAGLASGRAGRRLRDRHHWDLAPEKVHACTGRTLAWEAMARARGWVAAHRVLERNDWWSATAKSALPRLEAGAVRYLFSYCYEAHGLFNKASEAGWIPVLGQIDPGPGEDRKVTELGHRWSDYRTPFQPGTADYYDRWRRECRLARHIVVNSEWARQALEWEGIEAAKIAVCPLVYTPPPEAVTWERSYPEAFTARRPLRALFLGQCILRKGIAEAIEAAQKLTDRPIEFTFVGNTDIAGLGGHFGRARIRHFPRVSRDECKAFFRAADVFIFPTHSDGFGLTQLEAQAWKLPIVASQFCGQVVKPGETGWVLPEVSGEAIAAVLADILADPTQLAARSAAIAPQPYGLEQLGRDLVALGQPEFVSP